MAQKEYPVCFGVIHIKLCGANEILPSNILGTYTLRPNTQCKIRLINRVVSFTYNINGWFLHILETNDIRRQFVLQLI